MIGAGQQKARSVPPRTTGVAAASSRDYVLLCAVRWNASADDPFHDGRGDTPMLRLRAENNSVRSDRDHFCM